MNHRIDALLAISSRSWPMLCASTNPSHTSTFRRTGLATLESRSGGWSDAERLGEVVSNVDGFGLRLVEHHLKSWKVTGFDQRFYC